MMNSLLKRQIRKHLSGDLAESKELQAFFEAIDSSYNNFEEQFGMLQRAMTISSDELYNANQKLKQEAEAQKEVIGKLKHVIETFQLYELPNQKNKDILDLDSAKLADFIDNQAQKILEINKQREKLLEELAYQNQELSDYAHMVSHDLKSPLRSIDTLTFWLKEDYEKVFDDNGKESMSRIRENVEKMDLLINGILEYSTIGKTQDGIYNIDINHIVDEIVNRIDVPETITIVKNCNLPVIQGDKYRLQQVFRNLITNAINFNDKKEGVIEVGCENTDGYWQFYVKDNGKGIDEKYFDKIFKTFRKLENKTGSTGIGLSIVKKIVNMYGGEVWVKSAIGKGSTFYFTIKK